MCLEARARSMSPGNVAWNSTPPIARRRAYGQPTCSTPVAAWVCRHSARAITATLQGATRHLIRRCTRRRMLSFQRACPQRICSACVYRALYACAITLRCIAGKNRPTAPRLIIHLIRTNVVSHGQTLPRVSSAQDSQARVARLCAYSPDTRAIPHVSNIAAQRLIRAHTIILSIKIARSLLQLDERKRRIEQ